MMTLKQSVARLCLCLPIVAGALTIEAGPALAEGQVHLFHRSAAEPMRAPRMAMWSHCAEKLDIEIIEKIKASSGETAASRPPEVWGSRARSTRSSSTPSAISSTTIPAVALTCAASPKVWE